MAGIVNAIGFDIGTDPSKRFNSVSGTAISIGAFGRNGTSGLRFITPSSGSIVKNCGVTVAAVATIYAGFSIKMSALPLAGATRELVFLRLRDGGFDQVYFTIVSDGTIRARKGADSSILGTTSFAFVTATQYHFQIKMTVHNSAGIIETKVNDSATGQLTLSSIDTQNTGSAQVTEVVLSGSSIAGLDIGAVINLDMDDFVIRDDTWPGDCRVREILPTGTGSVDDGVATGAADTRQAVDDTDPDDDTSHADLQNVGDKFLLTYPTITATNIHALLTLPYVAKSAAGTAECKPAFLIGASDYLGSTIAPSAGSYAYAPQVHMVSPDTGLAWTAAEINAMESGIERTA